MLSPPSKRHPRIPHSISPHDDYDPSPLGPYVPEILGKLDSDQKQRHNRRRGWAAVKFLAKKTA